MHLVHFQIVHFHVDFNMIVLSLHEDVNTRPRMQLLTVFAKINAFLLFRVN